MVQVLESEDILSIEIERHGEEAKISLCNFPDERVLMNIEDSLVSLDLQPFHLFEFLAYGRVQN